ncbi:YbaB/EbfC family nucleoid-associated protein [Xanthobacter sediminis]
MRDLFGMMKQAKELQERMQQMQAELDSIEVEGISGGGLVAARVTAKGECKAVRIDPSLAKPDEMEILEDLIVAALADARAKAERVMQEKMQGLTGGLSLPPGMKLF